MKYCLLPLGTYVELVNKEVAEGANRCSPKQNSEEVELCHKLTLLSHDSLQHPPLEAA
jgi:hypothetical protein